MMMKVMRCKVGGDENHSGGFFKYFRFRVTSTLVHPFIEGMCLEEAMEASRLFIVDYSILEKADVDSERVVRKN